MLTPTVEHKRHIGTTRITASGSDQLSYCAASTRNTSTTASVNANIAVDPSAAARAPARSIRIAWPGEGWCSTSRSIASIAWPELTPGAAFKLIVADGYRLYRMSITGPLTSRILATDPSGTIPPREFRTLRPVRSFNCLRKLASPCTLTCQVRPNRLKSLT